MKNFVAALALVAAAGAAHADFTYPAFSLAGNRATNNNFAGESLLSIPAGNYGSYEILMDWSSDLDGTLTDYAWSSEPRSIFASAAGTGTSPTFPGGTTVFSSGTASPSNGASNSTNVTDLRIAGSFSTNFTGGNVVWNYRQAFAGTNIVNWNNIRITFKDFVPPVAPTAINLGGISGASLIFNTEGSSISGGDTEIGVYNSNGQLVGSDDDGGTGALSSLTLNGLADGVYYIAVAGYNAAFGGAFGVTTNSTDTGTIAVNVTNGVDTLTGGGALGAGQVQWYQITVPTPGALALVGVGGLVAARRRRA